MLVFAGYCEVPYDGEGGGVDDIDRVVIAVGHVDELADVRDGRAEIAWRRVRIDVPVVRPGRRGKGCCRRRRRDRVGLPSAGREQKEADGRDHGGPEWGAHGVQPVGLTEVSQSRHGRL